MSISSPLRWRRPTNCWRRRRGRHRSATAAASRSSRTRPRRAPATPNCSKRHCWTRWPASVTQNWNEGVCLVGPHRDDLELWLGDQVAKGFASHGESWSMALSLRLAAYELLRADGGDPVLSTRRCICRTGHCAQAGPGERRGVRRAGFGDRGRRAKTSPTDWDVTRIEITMRDDDEGRISEVESCDQTTICTTSAGRSHLRTSCAARSKKRGARRAYQGKDVGRGRVSPSRRVAGDKQAAMVRSRTGLHVIRSCSGR